MRTVSRRAHDAAQVHAATADRPRLYHLPGDEPEVSTEGVARMRLANGPAERSS